MLYVCVCVFVVQRADAILLNNYVQLITPQISMLLNMYSRIERLYIHKKVALTTDDYEDSFACDLCDVCFNVILCE